MDAKRLAIGTVAGGVVLYVVGYLIFFMIAADFYAANRGTATDAFRDAPLQWALALASLPLAALITLGIESRRERPTVLAGFIIGAVIAVLAWAHFDFIAYAAMTTRSLTLAIVDPILEIIHGGAAGAVIAAVLARLKTPRLASA